MCWMLSSQHREDHRVDENWAPQSEVIVDGTQKREIHLLKRVAAQSAAVMLETVSASNHLFARSMMVKR